MAKPWRGQPWRSLGKPWRGQNQTLGILHEGLLDLDLKQPDCFCSASGKLCTTNPGLAFVDMDDPFTT